MQNQSFRKLTLKCAGFVAIGATVLSGCVDHDYDLGKDIDLNVTLGGNELTLPVSSTDVYTMEQILDLDLENSSIKPVENDGEYGLSKGDYVLVQSGDPTESTFSIDVVTLTDVKGSTVNTKLDPFVVVPGLPEIVVPTGNIISGTSISDNDVTTDLRTLSWAKTECEMVMDVHYNSTDFAGDAIIKRGFTAKFDKSWIVEITDPATKAFAEMTDDHTLRFTTDKYFSSAAHPLVVKINVKAFNLTELPAGQGLYAPGKFNLESDIVFSGDVAIASGNLPSGTANLDLITKTYIPTAKLLAVKGIVDPQIDINPTSFQINDIPDFLSEPGNTLDVENPQLYFTVENTSNVSVNVNAILTSYTRETDGNSAERLAEVKVGALYGTSPISIAPHSTTNVCLSRTGVGYGENVRNVKVENLADLLKTVPGKIEITEIKAQADQTMEAEIALNDNEHPNVYHFNADYEAVVPLAFGQDLRLTYETDDKDWDEDLEKYNFDRVNLSFNVTNTAPLNMKPRVDALDHNGNVLSDITATIEGTVKAGTLQSPANTQLKAVLRSTAGNIKNLNGVRVSFDATTDAACVGIPLNEAQAMRFTDIRISITGGITIDLND